MKKFFLAVLASVVLLSCSKTNVKINGICQGDKLDGQKVYLAFQNAAPFDSVVIKKGKFSFKGEIDSTQIATISIGKNVSKALTRQIIYEKGNIVVDVDSNSNIAVSGTELNDILSDFILQNQQLDKKYENAHKISEMAVIEVDKEYVALGYNFAKNNAKNIVGKIAFLSSFWGMSIDQRSEILSLLDEKMKQDEKMKKIASAVEQEKRASVGQPFIDFTSKDPNDKEIQLSSLVGKTDYLLIDFWASWCGPCIKSLPAIKNLYGKYHGKKFDILGVSLDGNKEEWIAAIKKFELSWTNVSDLKKWDSQLAKDYAIAFIPSTILLDKEGRIVGRNLHINEIEDILITK